MPFVTDKADVGVRARRRIARRVFPFVFLMYIVNYIDRVNVSFANLRMSADLGFSDRVFGLGIGMFYVTYVLFEIPGAIIVERWSARKWIARIMISWGLITILTGFVHTAGQFYAARFILGSRRIQLFPGNDRVPDALVPSAGAELGGGVFICRDSHRLFGRLS